MHKLHAFYNTPASWHMHDKNCWSNYWFTGLLQWCYLSTNLGIYAEGTTTLQICNSKWLAIIFWMLRGLSSQEHFVNNAGLKSPFAIWKTVGDVWTLLAWDNCEQFVSRSLKNSPPISKTWENRHDKNMKNLWLYSIQLLCPYYQPKYTHGWFPF